MRILITGAQGMLGKDLQQVLKEKHHLILTGRQDLDITNYRQCKEFINYNNPELIINCAAYTYVDKCEEEIELVYRVNSIGPRNLAVISNDKNIPIVQISSDYVFDGAKGMNYLEDDLQEPVKYIRQIQITRRRLHYYANK